MQRRSRRPSIGKQGGRIGVEEANDRIERLRRTPVAPSCEREFLDRPLDSDFRFEGNQLQLVVDGQAASWTHILTFEQQLGSRTVRMGGIGGVGTHDDFRFQGLSRRVMTNALRFMRREGFELTVGKPEVLIREIDGVRHEPIERVTIDVPEDMMGVVTQLLALRKGRMEQVVNHGTGWTRLDYLVPARGLVGFRTEFLTETRGTGLLHSVFESWEPWQGEIRTRTRGSLVADRTGVATSFAMFGLQERGVMFVQPGDQVYEFLDTDLHP